MVLCAECNGHHHCNGGSKHLCNGVGTHETDGGTHDSPLSLSNGSAEPFLLEGYNYHQLEFKPAYRCVCTATTH